jgi:dihydropteroate synthase
MFTLNCNGKLLNLHQPVVMGILNVTPDSFYTGHLPNGVTHMVQLATQMLEEGAKIIDVGGQSTRPGSDRVDAQQEWERIEPVLEALLAAHPEAIISIDTYHSEVARKAVVAGAAIINDVSGGDMDPQMLATVGGLKVPYICMHMKGTPATMQSLAVYDDLMAEIIDYFILKIQRCTESGIHDVILDPGFGFAKTIEQNFLLLKKLKVLQMLGKPILAGLSRKSTIYKTLGVTAAEALNGSTVLNSIALLNGADILRVHDVKEAKETIQLIEAYHSA